MIGLIVCIIVCLFFGVGSLFLPVDIKIKSGQYTETKDWGDIAGGYQGNVGDKETHIYYDYIDYSLYENGLFIFLAVLFIIAVIALLVYTYLDYEGIIDEKPKLKWGLRGSVVLIYIISLICELTISGNFLILFVGGSVCMLLSCIIAIIYSFKEDLLG